MYDEAPWSWFGRSTTAGSPDLCGLLLSTATCLMAKDLRKKEPLKFLTKIVVVALHCDSTASSMSQFYMFLLSSSTMFYYIVQSSKIIESCNISTYIIYPNFPCCPGTTGFLWVNSGRRKRHLPPSPSTVWRWWRRQLLHRRLDEASKPAQSGLNWGSYCCIMIVYNCV